MTKKFDVVRLGLYAALVAVTMMLYQTWLADHPAAKLALPSQTSSSDYVPTLQNTATNTVTPAKTLLPPVSQNIEVVTDLLRVNINTKGGVINQVALLKYEQTKHSNTPVVLLNNDQDTRYVAQSDLVSELGPDTATGQATYTVDQTNYALGNNNELKVNLHWQNASGLQVTKTYTFHRDSYQIDVAYTVDNKSAQAWNGNLYLQLMRKNTPPESAQGLVSLATYFGAAVSSPDKPFQKIDFKKMLNTPYSQNIVGGWAAMVQHYFVSAWVPEPTVAAQYFSRVTSDGLYTIGLMGPKLSVAPGQTISTQAKLYVGPSIATNLEKVSPKLPLTIDYGIISLIALAIFWMMQKIYYVVGNWGWSIVIVTLIIKLMFYHLSAKSYRSMTVLKSLQPRITQLKEKYADDKQGMNLAMLELYKKEKVNPLSGCLPILVQIPVFLGLYWVLIASVELRQAPFILWIHDLSQKDPYYVLPLLMGLSMFLQQRLSPQPPDQMQATVMMLMPVVFTILFLNFPAGLMLYWFVNNSLSFLQQWYIMRTLKNKPAVKKKN